MEKKIDEKDPELKKLCEFAFDVISQQLTGVPKELHFPEKFLPYRFPLFVTWTIGKEKNLRGCVGNFQPKELKVNLENYAKIAAFQDMRFRPIKKEEIKTLNCGISLLVNFEEGKDAYDWEVGKHGIQINFGDFYRGTFLPEVAKEQGWDRKTTLQYLVRKAGYYGSFETIEKEIHLMRYQSLKVFMSYNEYQSIKNK